ncbi:MAG: hypothetical protein HFE45_11295 [Oscillospiraceae bacterium]|jgi:hypothetical protein|nr:hypothetical protein [Oscillospiraceae bacterium]
MNLQPLYDLKERLEQAAMAGVGLLGEDFRLKRAAEAMAPLAAASPVFKKIEAGVQGLLAAPKEARSGALLDTLALIDAVAYTQGSVGAAGELLPLASEPVGAYLAYSYSQLSPVLNALTSKGGGRMALLEQAFAVMPKMFSDFRVLPALVESGLGDSYGEIGDLCVNILAAQGEAALPLLYEGFDPAGKTAMVRRVQAIGLIEKEKANGFYLAQLEKAKGGVKEALIWALHYDAANAEQLAILCQTEKGKNKEAAHWALSRLDSPVMEDYFRKLAEKAPLEAVNYLWLAASGTASRLTAELFLKTIAPFEADLNRVVSAEQGKLLTSLLWALPGKSGPEICEAYRRCAALKLSGRMAEKDGGHIRVRGKVFAFDDGLPMALYRSVMFQPSAELRALAEELCGKYGGLWATPVLAHALLTKSAAGAYEQAEALLGPKGFFENPNRQRVQVAQALFQGLTWDEEKKCFQLNNWEFRYYTTVSWVDAEAPWRQQIFEPLDLRWYDLLLEVGTNGQLDGILGGLLNSDNPEICQKLGRHFYDQITSGQYDLTPHLPRYVQYLTRCGWKDWEGLVPKAALARKRINWSIVPSMLEMMPITNAERLAQLTAVDELYQSKKITAVNNYWPQKMIESFMARWHDTPDKV